MSFRLIKADTLQNDYERLGTIQTSILTTQLKLRDLGMGAKEVGIINLHLSGLLSTLWALFPMEIEKAMGSDEGTKILKTLNDQVNEQLSDIKGLLKEFISQAEANKNAH